jgi:hypothetical protein
VDDLALRRLRGRRPQARQPCQQQRQPEACGCQRTKRAEVGLFPGYHKTFADREVLIHAN